MFIIFLVYGRFSNGRLHPPEDTFEGCIRHQAWFISVNWAYYICESKAYYNNLHLTKNNGQIYNC